MKKNIWLPTPYPCPSPAAVAAYLLARGWVEFDTGDAHWRTFHRPGELEHVAEVPMDPDAPLCPVLMARCLEAIAAVEDCPACDVYLRVTDAPHTAAHGPRLTGVPHAPSTLAERNHGPQD